MKNCIVNSNEVEIVDGEPMMNHIQIADLLGKQQHHIRDSIKTLYNKGLIKMRGRRGTNKYGKTLEVLLINERDSYVVVAQNSPEFTAKLVDEWISYRNGSAPKPKVLPKMKGMLKIAKPKHRIRQYFNVDSNLAEVTSQLISNMAYTNTTYPIRKRFLESLRRTVLEQYHNQMLDNLNCSSRVHALQTEKESSLKMIAEKLLFLERHNKTACIRQKNDSAKI